MRVNNNCIRDVINYVIDNAVVIFDTTRAGYEGISLLSVIKALSQDDKYAEAEVLHACLYAYNYGLLLTDKRIELKNLTPSLIDILDVSPAGYKFIEENK